MEEREGDGRPAGPSGVYLLHQSWYLVNGRLDRVERVRVKFEEGPVEKEAVGLGILLREKWWPDWFVRLGRGSGPSVSPWSTGEARFRRFQVSVSDSGPRFLEKRRRGNRSGRRSW